MKRHVKLFISIILVVTMLFSISSPSFSAAKYKFVALGDSTAYGLSAAEGCSYNDLFYKSLGSNYSRSDLCWPGYTTADLITVINNNPDTIRNAKVITINIGGNNLLGPFMQAVAGLYGLNLSDYTAPNGSDFLAALASEVATDENPLAKISKLNDPKEPVAIKLNTAFLAGLAKFYIDWPVIMAKVKTLAPKAKIYVNTVYNPMGVKDYSDPLYWLYSKVDILIKSMNYSIKSYSQIYKYKYADVYSAFAYSNEAVLSFDIIAAFNTFQFAEYLDPHPTTKGHYVIYKLLSALR